MLDFLNVYFEYEKGNPVIDNLNVKINEGESVGLIGANGAGKSTIMKMVLGLIPHNGEINVDGIAVNKKNLADVRKKIGYVLQNSDNQMFMPTVFEDMIFGPVNYGMSKADAEKKVDEILEKLNLSKLKNRYNHKISGGEKRMAAIASVLAMEPKILFLDEPTIALDPYNRRTVINTMNSLNETKLIASHDLDMIYDTCERVLLLSNGKIVADGSKDEILKNKKLLENNYLELPFSFSKV